MGFLLSDDSKAQLDNIAPDVTSISANNVNTGTIGMLVDENIGTCGSQQLWISTSDPPAGTPGANYIEWEWAEEKTFDTIQIHHGHDNRRHLTGWVLQSWDGGQWVTEDTQSGLVSSSPHCSTKVGFDPVTTYRARITAFEMTGPGQTSNPSFRELEIFEAAFGLDVGAAEVVSPATFQVGQQDLEVGVENQGEYEVGTFNVGYQLEGQSPVEFTDTSFVDSLSPDDEEVFTFTGNYQIDIPATGGCDELKVWATNPNGVYPDSMPWNDTVTTLAGTPIQQDTFYVGSGQQYESLTEAFEQINCAGLAEDAYFILTDNHYDESIEDFPVGLSDFPNPGEYSVTITTQTNTTIENSDGGVFSFSGLDGLTIDPGPNNDLTLIGEDGDDILEIRNSDDVTLRNMQIEGNGGVENGIYASGSNITVENNEITEIHHSSRRTHGVLFTDVDQGLIHNNEIHDIETDQRSGDRGAQGIRLEDETQNIEISRNEIHNIECTDSFCGGKGIGIEVEFNANIDIFNNIIHDLRGDGSISVGDRRNKWGIHMSGDGSNIGIYHNTIANTTGSVSDGDVLGGIWLMDNVTDVEIINNIIVSDVGGNDNYAVFADDQGSGDFTTIDHNLYYSDDNLGYLGGTQSDLSDWQGATGQDANSVEDEPNFVDPGNNDFTPSDQAPVSSALLNGTPLGNVPEDIHGEQRDGDVPTIGAIEVPIADDDLAIMGVLDPLATDQCGIEDMPLEVVVRNMGINDQSGFDVTIEFEGDTSHVVDSTYSDVLTGGADGLDEMETDTFKVGYYNSLGGGNIELTAYHGLTPDDEPANDTASLELEIYEVPEITSMPEDVATCGPPGSVELNAATSRSDFEIQWYALPEGGDIIAEGETYNTPDLDQTQDFYLQSVNPGTACDSRIRDGERRNVEIRSYRDPEVSLKEGDDFSGTFKGDSSVVCEEGVGEYELQAPASFSNQRYGADEEWHVISVDVVDENQVSVPDALYNFTEPSGGDAGEFEFEPTSAEQGEEFTIIFEVENNNGGCIAYSDHNVRVPARPTADLSLTTSGLCLGEELELTNESSVADGQALNYTIEFGDGRVVSTDQAETHTHTYQDPGEYTIELHAQSEDGCSDMITQDVEVSEEINASLTASDVEACVGESIAFESLSRPDGLEHQWDFGDGETADGESVSHTYDEAGTYEVSLTSATDVGCGDEAMAEIEVIEIPEAGFEAEDVCLGERMDFENQNRFIGMDFHWDFDDGSESGEFDPIHTYEEAGTYDVEVTTTNELGCSNTFSDEVEVHENPESGFTSSVEEENFYMEFTPDESGLASYEWLIDDNLIEEENPQYRFEEDGFFDVALTTTNEEGCESTTVQEVEYWSSEIWTGIEEDDAGFDITAYPNPSSGTIAVEIVQSGDREVKAFLYRTDGKEVRQFRDVENVFTVNAEEDLEARLYLLNVEIGGESHTKRIEILE